MQGEQEEAPGLTALLIQSRSGSKSAFDQLIPLVYRQLHDLAAKRIYADGPGQNLRATELVNEAYLRLVDAKVDWNDRVHFYAVAARVMRRILVDQARSRMRGKRGGGLQAVTLDTNLDLAFSRQPELLEVHEALDRLAAIDARKSDLIELLIFGGLTFDEAAEALKISPATVHREAKLAKAWLYKELSRKPGEAAAN